MSIIHHICRWKYFIFNVLGTLESYEAIVFMCVKLNTIAVYLSFALYCMYHTIKCIHIASLFVDDSAGECNGFYLPSVKAFVIFYMLTNIYRKKLNTSCKVEGIFHLPLNSKSAAL